MTQPNPTLAEVQAAYDSAAYALTHGGYPFIKDLAALLAAVERDTLGWREASWREWNNHLGCKKHAFDGEGTIGYWIKDAAP